MKPALFFLLPAEDGRTFCPESALLKGVLKSYSAILQSVDVEPIALCRPRPELIELLGAENQCTPVLVFPDEMEVPGASRARRGVRFLSGPGAIVDHFAGQGLSGRLAS